MAIANTTPGTAELRPGGTACDLRCRREYETLNERIYERMMREDGAAGSIFMWLMGVPASVLFLVFLVRGCN